MGHDQLFKGVLRRFLREFLELFFPEVAARLDFHSLEFPDKELFKGFPNGAPREPDVVARVRAREGKPEIVMVHVETQAGTEPGFGRRMFEYYALLWLQFGIPIFPIVLYVKEGNRDGLAMATYREELFGYPVMTFHYASVALARIEGQEYVEKGPLAAALSTLMRWGGGEPTAERHAKLLLRVVTGGLDEAAEFLLMNLIKTYLPLPEEARERYGRLLSGKEYRKVQEMELSWADKLRAEGIHEGLVRGKRETLKKLLVTRFGKLPSVLETRIDRVASEEELDRYLDRILTARSLEELGLEG
jgi:hypothetical protein